MLSLGTCIKMIGFTIINMVNLKNVSSKISNHKYAYGNCW